MAVTTNGFTSSTPQRYLLDAGAIYYNLDYATLTGTLLGATSGGNELVITPELRQTEVDGIKGRHVGGQHIVTEDVQLTVNLKEWTASNLAKAIAGTTIDTATDLNYDIVESKGKIEDADYLDNITFVGKLSGNDDPVIIQLFNVLSLEGLSVTFEDNNEAVLPIVFGAHHDGTGASPYKIYFPKAV